MRILIVTPSLKGGSWIFHDELIKRSTYKFHFIVASGGMCNEHMPYATFSIPVPDYSRWGFLLSLNPLFSILHAIPISILSCLLTIIYRPKIIIGNGVICSLTGAIIAKQLGAKVVVSHHGEIRHYTPTKLRRLARSVLSHFVDHAFVNSRGSKQDMAHLMSPNRITVVRHWADSVFFSPADRTKAREQHGFGDKFVVLYVGNLNREKMCDVLIRISDKLATDQGIMFAFVGSGELENKIRRRMWTRDNVRLFDYIRSRSELHQVYASANLVWGPADSTYISRPAVEALASGNPILVPDASAVYKRRMAGARVNPETVPASVGWIVDHSNIDEIASMITKIKNDKAATSEMREACAKYARARYSPSNIDTAIRVLSELVNNEHRTRRSITQKFRMSQ